MEHRQTHLRPESLAGDNQPQHNYLTEVGKSFKFVNMSDQDFFVAYREGLVNKVRGDRLNHGSEINIVVEYLTGNPRYFEWEQMDQFDIRLSQDTIKALKEAARYGNGGGFNTFHSGLFSNRVVLYYQIDIQSIYFSSHGLYINDLNILLFSSRHHAKFPKQIIIDDEEIRDYFRDIELGASILFYSENKNPKPLYTVFGTDIISIMPITDGLRPAGVYIQTCDEISFVTGPGKERKEKFIPYEDLEKEGYYFDAYRIAQWIDGGKNKEFNERLKSNINDVYEERKNSKQAEEDRMNVGDYLDLAETFIKVINVAFNMFIAWKKTGK